MTRFPDVLRISRQGRSDLRRDREEHLMPRNTDSELVQVNGRSLGLEEASVALDLAWGETDLLDGIVDWCLLQQAAEAQHIEVGEEELQAEIERLCAERGLFSAPQTLAWLDERSVCLEEVERRAEGEVRRRKLKHLLVGAEAERAFAADPSLYAEISVAAFPAPTEIEALLWAGDVEAGASFFAVAERELSAARGVGGGRGVVFETVRRVDLSPLSITDEPAERLRPRHAMAATLREAGPHVVLVRAVAPAQWNDACREAIEDRLLREWLARARDRAQVSWSWGRRPSAARAKRLVPRRSASATSASSC
jgi:hypothetical protein